MKTFYFIAFTVILSLLTNQQGRIFGETIDESISKSRFLSKVPLAFIENQGQIDERAEFVAYSQKATVYFTLTEAVFHFAEKASSKNGKSHKELVLRAEFLNANREALIEGREMLPGKINIFRGNDSSKWLTNIPTYREIFYKNLWSGINLIYRGEESYGLKYDFVIQPGADPAQIRFRYHGCEGISVNSSNELIIKTALGDITEKVPSIYQAIDGKHIEVKGSFEVIDSGTVGYRLGDYDKNQELVIDPGLLYSTFIGGAYSDSAYEIFVDSLGQAYITGYTASLDFPVSSGAYDTTYNWNGDVFVTKLNQNGNGIIYSTYIGTDDEEEEGRAIAVDASGNAYITGYTISPNFPTTPGAYDTTYNSIGDVFLLKLNSTGSALIYSTYIGGSGYEMGNDVVVDGDGYAYVCGTTDSANFPKTAGAFDESYNNWEDGFVLKMNQSGSALAYSTFLGGAHDDFAFGICLDSLGNAFITGATDSDNFPVTPGAYDINWILMEAFVAKLNATGSDMLSCTFLGGSSEESADAIVLDKNGDVYICGGTHSSDFPTTPGGYDTTYNGNGDFFVTKLYPTLDHLYYSTYIGGSTSIDYAFGIQVDNLGQAYIAGRTESSGFPTTPGAFDTTFNGIYYDSVLIKLNRGGSDLLYSTYIGGDEDDIAYAIALDSYGNAYVVGATYSSDYPTTSGAYDTSHNGECDAFVTKFYFTRFVNVASGNDLYDGLAMFWNGTHGPKRTIQAAINVAQNADSVIVNKGTYVGNGNRDLDFLGKKIVLCSRYGDPTETIIDCQGTPTDIHRGIYFHNNELYDSIINGFTVRNGYLTSEVSGAGIYSYRASPRIFNCIFENNTADTGGAIYCYDNANMRFENCIFKNNHATLGGGLHNADSDEVILIDCIFEDNSAQYGGGIYLQNSLGRIYAEHCIFTGNAATAYGGAEYERDNAQSEFVNCLFADNSAMIGGAIYSMNNCNSYYSHSTFADNAATTRGGAVRLYTNSYGRSANCLFWENTTPNGSQISITFGGILDIGYTDIQGGSPGIERDDTSTLNWLSGNFNSNPLFICGALNNYYLSQISAGQAVNSPCLNAGSKSASDAGLDGRTTRSDGVYDAGTVDIGYHSPYALWIYSIERVNKEDIKIKWSKRPEKSYYVNWSTDMTNWIETFVGSVGEWTDTDAAAYMIKYYTVLEQE
jgi:predicted outer membrane repeat protein